jgi:hypothetical protein
LFTQQKAETEKLYRQLYTLLEQGAKPDFEQLQHLFYTIQDNYTASLNSFYKEAQKGTTEDSDITIAINFNRELFTSHKAIFISIKDFSELADAEDVLQNNANMSISLYVRQNKLEDEMILPFAEVYANWLEESEKLKSSMNDLFQILN